MLYNIGSLILGLAAWLIPLATIKIRSPWVPFVSFGCCGVSLVLQFYEIGRRVNAGDFSGIEDTIGAVIFSGVVLLCVTFLLNLLALIRGRRN